MPKGVPKNGENKGWFKSGFGYWSGKKRAPFSKEQREKMSRSALGKKKSPESVKKSALSRRGKPMIKNLGHNNPNWNGGSTPVNQKIRTSLEYKIWRRAVFERDSYTCIWGGKEHGSELQADHIKPFAHYPELRFAIDNGRTLCKDCHKTTDTYGWKTNKLKKYGKK